MALLADEPNNDEAPDKLPEDQETPFRPANDPEGKPELDDTHPITDTDIDDAEQYDEGVGNAAGAKEPNASDVQLEDAQLDTNDVNFDEEETDPLSENDEEDQVEVI